ncbi:MAG: isoamylase early set domain-containing protein [Gemmatimonadaceae bacterium]
MTDRDRGDGEEFIERVARELREPEVLDDGFERRVMATVRADRGSGRARWRRPFTLSSTPVWALAMAAGFAGIVAAGTIGVQLMLDGPAAESTVAGSGTAVDTVHVVRFVLAAAGAREVAVVGDFNAWSHDATRLAPVGEGGVWSVSLPLTAGRHEYAFVVDGERWVADPLALRHVDEFGTESSILRVGAEVQPGA